MNGDFGNSKGDPVAGEIRKGTRGASVADVNQLGKRVFLTGS